MATGILNINKPGGMTSFSVVSRVRRFTGIRRVGHAGTLDPMATGVLPICVGSATRVVEYLLNQPKTYRGSVRLGVTTDTFDGEGKVTASADAGAVTAEDVLFALQTFIGEINQVPPVYSALKREGRPLYDYARAGHDIEVTPRRVQSYSVALLQFESGLAEIEVQCGRGFYVRSLAHDLGQALGCGAHLAALTRTLSGPFALEDAISLETLESVSESGGREEHLLATDRALESLPAAILGEEHSTGARHGRNLNLGSFTGGVQTGQGQPLCRAYSSDGDFLAVLRRTPEGAWSPSKVFSAQ